MATTASLRQERRALITGLRAQQHTWVEIATILAGRYSVNRRVAFRLARDWSQRQAAEAWNEQWPDDPKTFKNFSYWEQWPAATGYAPSLDVLTRLAQLYQCSIADLTADCSDFRSQDAVHRAKAELVTLESALGNRGEATAGSDLEPLMYQLDAMGIEEIASVVRSWMSHAEPTARRRAVLLKLAAALSIAASGAPTRTGEEQFPGQDADDQELSGLWLSRYSYHSSGRDEEFHGEHSVQIRRHGDRLVGRSESSLDESRLKINLSISRAIATGTWTERTALNGYYKGATYHGTVQLIISPHGRSMSGRWLGFNKEFKVNTGEWHLERISETSPSRTTVRQA